MCFSFSHSPQVPYTLDVGKTFFTVHCAHIAQNNRFACDGTSSSYFLKHLLFCPVNAFVSTTYKYLYILLVHAFVVQLT